MVVRVSLEKSTIFNTLHKKVIDTFHALPKDLRKSFFLGEELSWKGQFETQHFNSFFFKKKSQQ